MPPDSTQDPASVLPLTPLSLAILLALADADRHGYGIIKEVERQTDGQLRVGTGSLYAALQRMTEEGLLAEAPRDSASGEDPRRRPYRLTPFGREVARAEAQRMTRVLAVARAKRIVLEGPLLPRPADA